MENHSIMKRLMIVGSIWLSSLGSLSAQGWAPITLSDTFNYQADTASHITHTLWVDSVQVINGDSVFFLNRVVSPCDTCNVMYQDPLLMNQPQFLQRQITKKIDGQYVVEDSLEFTLFPDAGLHDSWVFDSTLSILAAVTGLAETSVLGTVDSVKIIELSSGESLILSKYHGILQFPGYDGKIYQLVGIESRNLGERVPTFHDFFDFQVGDVLEYFIDNCHFGVGDRYLSIEKHEILDRIVHGDTLIYETRLHLLYWNSYPFYPVYFDSASYVFPASLTFIDSANHITNQYPSQILYNVEFDNDLPLMSWLNFFPKDSHLLYKQTGTIQSNESFYNPIYIVANEFDSTLFEDLMIPYSYNVQAYFTRYAVGLGQVAAEGHYFESYFRKLLTGAVVNGDTTGVITPDAQLMVGLEAEIPAITQARISPNPNEGQFLLRFSAPTQQALSFQIMGMDGRIIQHGELAAGIQDTVFELRTVSPGIYALNLGNGTKRVSYTIAVR